jgi:alpha-tubulin suppressor-like RCC1 family protein
VRTDHTLWCWGFNGDGQLGYDTGGTPETTPGKVGSKSDWSAVTIGGATCGIRTDHTLWCWGPNGNGQLGDNTTGPDRFTPKQVGTRSNWASVSAGASHTCAVRTDHTLWCWGGDAQGQIGDGAATAGNHVLPTRVGTRSDWSAVSSGYQHTCGVRTDHTLWCWGSDGDGQLGDGETIGGQLAPHRVGSRTDWSSVSSGNRHTCGIRTDHSLWCWGGDGYEQLGDGAGGDFRPSPTKVGTQLNWSSIRAGTFHTCGTRTDHTLWCWGWNSDGQIGDGTSGTNRSIPKRVGSLKNWAKAGAGGSHTCGVRTDHHLWCWGDSGNGAIGDGSTSPDRLSPVRVS